MLPSLSDQLQFSAHCIIAGKLSSRSNDACAETSHKYQLVQFFFTPYHLPHMHRVSAHSLPPILQYTSLIPDRTPRQWSLVTPHSRLLQGSPSTSYQLSLFLALPSFLSPPTRNSIHNVPSRRNPSRYPEALHRRLGRLDHGVLLRHSLR